MPQARQRKMTIRLPFFQGDYLENGTVFCPELFLNAAVTLKKDNPLIPILSGRLLGRWNSVPPWAFLNEAGTLTIWFPFFQGDYWEDGLVFRPERFLDAAGTLKKEHHLISILSGWLLGRWNCVPPWVVPWRGGCAEERRPSDSYSFRATTGKMELCSALSGYLTRQARWRKTTILIPILLGGLLGGWTSVPPWAVTWRGRHAKERRPFDSHSFRATTGKMEQCSALSGSLTRQARWRKTTIWFPSQLGSASVSVRRSPRWNSSYSLQVRIYIFNSTLMRRTLITA